MRGFVELILEKADYFAEIMHQLFGIVQHETGTHRC